MKSTRINICILSAFFLLILILNCFTPFRGDDFGYRFIFDNGTAKVKSITDIIQSQYNNYYNSGGRIIVHSIVQFFTAIAGKPVFNLINALMAVIYVWLMHRLIDDKKRPTISLLLVISLIWVAIPVFDSTLLWLSGSVNYLWSTTICLFFLYRLFKKNNEEATTSRRNLTAAIIGLLAGWSQEGIAVGIAAGLGIHYLFNFRKLQGSSLYMVSAFLVGTLFLCLSPGNFIRAGVMISSSDVAASNVFIRTIKLIVINSESLHLVFLLIILLFIGLIKNRGILLKFIKNNHILFLALTIQYLFICMSGHVASRAFFGVESIALLLFMRLLSVLSDSSNFAATLYKVASYVLTALILILYIPIVQKSVINYADSKLLIENIEKKCSDVIVPYNTSQTGYLARFVLGGEENPEKQHNPRYWENVILARYYNKQQVILLPSSLYKVLFGNNDYTAGAEHICDGFFKHPNYAFFIKKITADVEKEIIKTNDIRVTYTIESANEKQTGIIKRVLRPLFNSLAATNKELTDVATIIPTPNSKYLLVDKILKYDDSRIKSIQVNYNVQ